MTDSLSIGAHALNSHVFTSFSVDETLLLLVPDYVARF